MDRSLFECITDNDKEENPKGMEEMNQMDADDIANSIFHSLNSSDSLNINDMFLMPTEQDNQEE